MTFDEVVVAVIVVAAVAFVVRRFAPKKKPAPRPGPDVPVSKLVRRKKPPSER